MSNQRYVILRAPGVVGKEVFSGLSSSRYVTEAVGPIPQLAVDVEKLDGQEVADIRRDPAVIGVAPPMAMRLIAPVDGCEMVSRMSSGSTWGVEAVGGTLSPYRGEGVCVAVLDTGMDHSHEPPPA